MAQRTSLASLHPRRWNVPAAIVGTAVLLTVGLSLPVLHVEKLVFWKDEYSIWSGIVGMAQDKHYGLAALIFFFSIVFPYGKLITLAWLWWAPMSDPDRQRTLKWLETLGRWSMLDVFVVAIIVVITKAGGLLDASPKVGIYLFAAAIVASMLVTIHIGRLAKKSPGRHNIEP